MSVAVLSSKFQLCIPKEIRERMHLKKGQQFVFLIHGNSLQLVPKREISEIRGMMKGIEAKDIRDEQDRTE